MNIKLVHSGFRKKRKGRKRGEGGKEREEGKEGRMEGRKGKERENSPTLSYIALL